MAEFCIFPETVVHSVHKVKKNVFNTVVVKLSTKQKENLLHSTTADDAVCMVNLVVD